MEHGQKVLFSNFLITISTNVVPIDHAERVALATWLRDEATNLFDDLAMLNGTVLKPADSPNEEKATFDDDNRIERIRSKISLEAGEQRGQMHMHVLMEVAHMYRDHRNAWGGCGVHVNVKALRDYLNSRIHAMEISPGRRPPKIYVNSRLITSRDNPSAKWLALAYINKQRDAAGRSLVDARLLAPAEDQQIHRAMLQPDDEFEKRYNEEPAAIVQAAPPGSRGGTAPSSRVGTPMVSRAASPEMASQEEEPREPMRFPAGRRQSRRIVPEETSSYVPGQELNPNVVWNPGRRRKERREREKDK